jgi:hypothetical protein
MSLNHLGRLEQQRWGNHEAQILRRLEVDDELECHGLLHGQVGGLGHFEDLVHLCGGTPPEVSVAQPIGHEPASVRLYSEGVNGRQPVLGREVDDVAVVRVDKGSTALNVRLLAISAIALRG